MNGAPLRYCAECGEVTPHRIMTSIDLRGDQTTILECKYSGHHGVIPVDCVDY